jgi:hypothetical protein
MKMTSDSKSQSKAVAALPPTPLPALPDPVYGNKPGPYSASGLRDVVGTRINPDAVAYYKNRERHMGITGAFPELEGWLGDIGSFDPHARLVQPPPSEWPLSLVVPRMTIWGESLPFEIQPATYMIDYLSLNSDPKSLPTRPWVNNLRERFPEGSRLLLSFFGPEGPHGRRPLINGLWEQRDFWFAPFLDQFDATVLPDFDVYSDSPKPQSLVGERQAQMFAQEGSEAGRTVIPAVAWATEASLRRQIELWCGQYPHINTILLDCYGAGAPERIGWAWHWLFAIEKYCGGKDHIRWLLTGMTAGWIVRELNNIFPHGNYSLVTSASPQIAATRGTTNKELMASRFRRSVAKLEDFQRGRVIADPQPRPDHWLSFSDVFDLDD